jgi:hypothetical protein
MAEVTVAEDHSTELVKEGSTMALYVAICLLATLTALPDTTLHDTADLLGLIWGTTIGLALAHWFAFHVSSRLVARGTVRVHDAQAALVQVAGAALVGVLSTLAVLLTPDSAEHDVVRLVLAAFIASIGYLVAKETGASRRRSVLYALTVLIAAFGVVLVKNLLIGH